MKVNNITHSAKTIKRLPSLSKKLISHFCQIENISQSQMGTTQCYQSTSVRIRRADSGSIPTPIPPPPLHFPSTPSPLFCLCGSIGGGGGKTKNQISFLSDIFMTDNLDKVSEDPQRLIRINLNNLTEWKETFLSECSTVPQ